MLDESVPDGLANKHTPLTQHQCTPTSRYRLLLNMVCDVLRLTTFVRQHHTECIPPDRGTVAALSKGRFALMMCITSFEQRIIPGLIVNIKSLHPRRPVASLLRLHIQWVSDGICLELSHLHQIDI